LQDSETVSLCRQQRGPLFLVTTAIDDLILRTIGLPSAMSIGVDDMKSSEIDEFCERLCFLRRMHQSPQVRPLIDPWWGVEEFSPESARLVLVAWSPRHFSEQEPKEIRSVLDHLEKLHRSFKIPFSGARIWRPSRDYVDCVRFALTHGTREDFAAALFDRLQEFYVELFPRAPEPVLEFADAHHKWLALHSRDGSGEERKKAWHDYLVSLDEKVIEPLVRTAMASADPVQRAAGVALADLMRIAHPHAALIAADLRRSVRQGNSETPVDFDAAQLQPLLANYNSIRALIPEAKQCSLNQQPLMSSNDRSLPSLLGSASRPTKRPR
jgi:hypothetical protein